MRDQFKKLFNVLESISFHFSSILIFFAQYVPCASIWFGIMSIPLISYLFLFFQYPGILEHDIVFFLGFPGSFLSYFGLGLAIYCLIYQLIHRKNLIITGPYKIIRHPQYAAFIIMTLGLTITCFNTYPIIEINSLNINGYLVITLIWIGELSAYILLAKVEEIALKAKYGDEYIDYANRVGFMIPRFSSKK